MSYQVNPNKLLTTTKPQNTVCMITLTQFIHTATDVISYGINGVYYFSFNRRPLYKYNMITTLNSMKM